MVNLITFYCKFPADCDTGRILKIGQYLMKLCLKYYWFPFFPDTVYSRAIDVDRVDVLVRPFQSSDGYTGPTDMLVVVSIAMIECWMLTQLPP